MANLIERNGKTYIDMTPTWAEILPALLMVLEDGTPKGRAEVKEELRRMAAIADLYVKSQKGVK